MNFLRRHKATLLGASIGALVAAGLMALDLSYGIYQPAWYRFKFPLLMIHGASIGFLVELLVYGRSLATVIGRRAVIGGLACAIVCAVNVLLLVMVVDLTSSVGTGEPRGTVGLFMLVDILILQFGAYLLEAIGITHETLIHAARYEDAHQYLYNYLCVPIAWGFIAGLTGVVAVGLRRSTARRH